MLKFLRGRKTSRNALLLIFVAILTLSLVGLFSVVVSGGGAGLFRGTGGTDTVIAKVGSYEVTVQELKDALNMYGQQIAQGQGRSQRDDLKTLFDDYGSNVLDSLIRQKLILFEANRLSLEATDNEVQARLRQVFAPWPGPEQYRMRLQQAGITPVRFEEDLRSSIAQEHLRSFITAAVQIDPKEVEEEYRRNNNSYAVRWVEVDPSKLHDKVQVNEPDLRAYFDSHKDDFKITTEQRRARYIFVDAKKAEEAVQVTDDELKQDFTPERFIKQVRVSQIVFNVPKEDAKVTRDSSKPAPPSKEEEIRKKAQGIVERAKAAEGKAAEDFAKLAREFSDDAKTKSKGGDLGWINKGDKRDGDDPLNRVFAMQKDDVTPPVKKGDKYYILKVTDRKIPTLADAHDELLTAARSRKGYSKAQNIATEAEQKLAETKNADAVVAELNKTYGAQVAVAKDTPFFADGDTLPDLGAASQLESIVFQLQNPGDTGKQVPVEKGFAVAQYSEKRDPHDPAYEEVKDKVDKAYRAEKAKGLAADRAKELAKATDKDQLKKIADSMRLKTDELAGINGSQSIGPLVTEVSREAVYKLKEGEVTREPIKTDGDVYVVAALNGRKDADMGEAFQKDRKTIEQRLLDEKRNRFFSVYLSMTQKQMRDEGKIKLYNDAITAAIDSSPAVPQSTQPGMPSRSNTRPRRTPQAPQGGLPASR